MTSAIGKQDMRQLTADAEYFSTELIRRLERLARIEPHGPTVPHWQQAAGLTRKVRRFAQHRARKERRRP